MAKTIKIKHRNKVDKVPGNQLIKAFFEAEVNFDSALYNFVWECMGNTATTSTPKVLLSLQSFHCNTPITISVKAQARTAFLPGLQFNNNVQTNADDEDPLPPLLRNIIYDELTFTPTCDVKFVSIDWCNKSAIPTYNDTPLPAKTFIVVSTQMQGLNGKDVIARLYNKHYEISLAGKVTNNLLDLLFFVAEQFLNGSDKSTVTLELTHQKKIIHSVSKEIEQPKTVITPNDSNPIQPVMVGTVNIVENNYLPCKYSKITATYTKDAEKTYARKDENPKEPVIIFDESRTTEAKKINFVGGTKKIDIELTDYKTDECKIKKGTKGSHTEHIAFLDNTLLSISNDGKTSFKLGYKYNELLPNEKLNPLKNIKNQIDIIKYIWPMKDGLIQHHTLKFATCRHSKTIPIDVYPDVKWELSFSLDLSSTEASMSKNLSGATEKKANKANKEFKEEKQYNLEHGQTGATFGLMLGATYDDEQQKNEVGIEFEKKIRDFFGVLLSAKEVADKVLDTAKDSKSQLPFSIKIDFPKLNASFSWCIVNRTATTVGVKGEFDFNADPLVGASFTLDLFKLGSRAIPIVAFLYDLINSQVKGKYVEYEGKLKLDLIFSGELKLNLANVSFETNPFEISAKKINLEGIFGVKLTLIIGISLKVKAFKAEAKTKIEGNASFDAYFAGTATLDIDEYGLFIAPEVKFSGMKAKLVFVAEFAFKSKWIKDNEVKANHETTFEAIIFDESPPLKLPRLPVI